MAEKKLLKFLSANLLAFSVLINSSCFNNPLKDRLPEKNLPEKVELFYFYEESCELCDELNSFYTILAEKLPHEIRELYPHAIHAVNIFNAGGGKIYEQVTDNMGMDRALLQVPVLIVGGKVFQGNDTISSNIREAYLTTGEDIFINRYFYNPAERKTGSKLFEDYSLNPNHVTVVYFYRTVCPYCEEIKPFIDALPKTVLIDGKEIPLDIIKINTRSGNNNERIIAFFEKYQVPDTDRRVPIVFLVDSYIRGVESIRSELSGKLRVQVSVNKLVELIKASP